MISSVGNSAYGVRLGGALPLGCSWKLYNLKSLKPNVQGQHLKESMGSYCILKEIALQMLEIQDDECPLKAISSGI